METINDMKNTLSKQKLVQDVVLSKRVEHEVFQQNNAVGDLISFEKRYVESFFLTR